MSKGFKTFTVTFLVGIIVFSFGASYLFKNVVDDFINDLLNIGQTESRDTSSDTSDDDTSNAESADESEPDTSYSEDFLGETMGTLILGKNQAGEVDSIILIRRNKEKSANVVCVIPPETRLNIDGRNTKLRDLLKTRTIDFFVEKVKAITGLGINYYFVVEYENIARIGDITVDKFRNLSYIVPYTMQKLKEVSVPEASVGDGSDASDDSDESNITDESNTAPETIYEIDIKAGRTALTGEMVSQIVTFYRNDSVRAHDELIADFVSSMLVQLYTTANKRDLTDIAASVLALTQTNMQASDFADNIDIITAYTAFRSEVITYPGEYRTLAGNSTYFNPDIDTAISQLKGYR